MTDQAFDKLARRVLLDAVRQEYGELMREPPEHDFSPAFEKKMEKLLQQANYPVRHRCLWALRIAAVLAALLTLLTVATAAAGYDIWRMLAEWTAETMTLAPGQIDYMNPDDIHIPEGPEKYADLQEALTAYGINRPVVPKQLPEGFTLDELIVDRRSSDRQIVFFASYHRGENYLIIQVNIYIENEYRQAESFWDVQKDEGDPIPYEAGGVIHLLATNAGRPMALWADGPAECSISGDITMEELKQLIDSIYEKD